MRKRQARMKNTGRARFTWDKMEQCELPGFDFPTLPMARGLLPTAMLLTCGPKAVAFSFGSAQPHLPRPWAFALKWLNCLQLFPLPALGRAEALSCSVSL